MVIKVYLVDDVATLSLLLMMLTMTITVVQYYFQLLKNIKYLYYFRGYFVILNTNIQHFTHKNPAR